MADPLSVAGSVVGIVSLSIQLTQSLVDFYNAYKNQKSDLVGILKKLDQLLGVLNALQPQLKTRKFDEDERGLLSSLESSIEDCRDDIDDLQHLAEKLKKSPTDSVWDTARTIGHRVSYPFREKTLQKLEDDIDEIVSQLSLALQILGQKDLIRLEGRIEETQALLVLVRAEQISSTIRNWLKAPDASGNYHQACEKRHPGTGLWFVQGDSFSNWLSSPSSFLWVNGFAGCGKSVLFSTAIQHTFRHRRSNPRLGIAFFFFTFNDHTKQDASSMLKALVLQLSGQMKDNRHLSRLQGNYPTGSPSKRALIDCLKQLVRALDQVYIMLDALDESPRGTHREDVLQALADIRSWNEPGLHILVTSRDEIDIREGLGELEHTVLLRNESIDRDIAEFVSQKLRDDRKLCKWKDHQVEIEQALTKGAKGVFRWVECQFTQLALCPRSKRNLDKLLTSLPRSLHQTYDRMLFNIDRESAEDARRILLLLCCSEHPLSVDEVIDGVAVELGDSPGLNLDGRLADEHELRRVCPGLIEVDTHISFFEGETYIDHPTVRIAHYSVKEYLQSTGIAESVAQFRIKQSEAQAEMTSICLSYLLDPTLSMDALEAEYPLARYAARRWHKHYHQADKNMHQIENQARRLFYGAALDRWHRIREYTVLRKTENEDSLTPSRIHIALSLASMLNLCSILQELLEESPPDADQNDGRDAIAQMRQENECYGAALFWGASNGHEGVVRLLLDKRVNPDWQHPDMGSGLIQAAGNGHKAVVRLMLDRGANVNATNKSGATALTEACSGNGADESMTRLLLQRGADISAPGGFFGRALIAASFVGQEAVVETLLKHGVDVDANGFGGTALCMAALFGHEVTARLLLDHGADVNKHGGGDFGHETALCLASEKGHDGVVRLLLEHGADPYIENGRRGTALHAAVSGKGDIATVRALLDAGVDLHVRSTYLDNSVLYHAATEGSAEMVEFLLDEGADLNTAGGELGNALHAACASQNEEIVRLLLDRGADLHEQGQKWGDALNVACAHGSQAIIRLLLDRGADVNAHGGTYGNALQAAACCPDSLSNVQLLLDRGAEIHAEGGFFGSALQAACFEPKNEAVVRLLLGKGADMHAQVGFCESALQAACALNGNEAIVRLLLDKGADIHAQGGEIGSPLRIASSIPGNEAVVRLLLDRGADANAQGGKWGHALMAASDEAGDVAIARLLLDNGADVNAYAHGDNPGVALSPAARAGKKDLVQLLLDYGAEVSVDGGTALRLAQTSGHDEIAQMLIDRGAKISEEDESQNDTAPPGSTPQEELQDGIEGSANESSEKEARQQEGAV